MAALSDARRPPRPAAARRRRPGPRRRGCTAQPVGDPRRRRRLELLPGQEPRRVRRRRRRHDRRRRARRARARGCATTAASAATSTSRWATTAGSTSCRPRSCASSSTRWTSGTGAARRIAARYLAELTNVTLHGRAPRRGAVLASVRRPSDRRDALRAHLDAAGVDTLIHYPVPPHRQGAYAGTRAAEAWLPVSDAIAASVLSLPISPHMRDDEVDRVIEAVADFG